MAHLSTEMSSLTITKDSSGGPCQRNYIKKTMYENNNVEEMSMELLVVQCTVSEEAVGWK